MTAQIILFDAAVLGQEAISKLEKAFPKALMLDSYEARTFPAVNKDGQPALRRDGTQARNHILQVVSAELQGETAQLRIELNLTALDERMVTEDGRRRWAKGTLTIEKSMCSERTWASVEKFSIDTEELPKDSRGRIMLEAGTSGFGFVSFSSTVAGILKLDIEEDTATIAALDGQESNYYAISAFSVFGDVMFGYGGGPRPGIAMSNELGELFGAATPAVPPAAPAKPVPPTKASSLFGTLRK